jgi:hypothetical protein
LAKADDAAAVGGIVRFRAGNIEYRCVWVAMHGTMMAFVSRESALP